METDTTEEAAPLPGADEFDVRRWRKWARGRAERGLPHDAPFDGDPAQEGRQECEDLANYADELHHQGRIDEAVRYRLTSMAREIDMLLGSV